MWRWSQNTFGVKALHGCAMEAMEEDEEDEEREEGEAVKPLILLMKMNIV